MLEKRSPRGVFHARMRQVEDQLFRAEYSGEINPEPTDARNLPDYHVGASAQEVKIWVEQGCCCCTSFRPSPPMPA
jgi:hypothetical protein